MNIFTDDFVYRKIGSDIFRKGDLECAVPYRIIADIFGVDKSHVANHPDGYITQDSLLKVMGVPEGIAI